MVDSELPSTSSLSDAKVEAIAIEAEGPVEDPQSGIIKGDSQDDRVDYVSGYKLAVVVASVALSCFLMLLDNLIVSTVSRLHAFLPSPVGTYVS
jgi:hypothetical protein